MLEPFDTKKELSYLIFYVALLLGGLYTMIASNKMAKADTPENLLVTYDKIKKIGVWTCIIVVALLVISMFLKDGFSKSNTFISCLLLAWISIIFFIAYSRDNQIKKLRDLIQKS
jgi:cell division protein FtsW (lipid II flippase)